MYCDLNIPCTAHPDRSAVDKLKLILSRLAQNQQCTVALNYAMEGSDLKNTPKISEKYDFDLPSLNLQYPLTILNRVTVNTNERLDEDTIASLREKFDLIAIRTSDRGIFQEACNSYNIDIISLHCTERLAFEIEPVDINAALQRKIYFELCYANALRDLLARTYTIQIAKQLVEYTQGKNCIISSEAEIVSEIRNSGDIFYFAKSLGLPNDKAKFTVEKHCEQLLSIVKSRHH